MKNHFKRASLRRRSGGSVTSPCSVAGSYIEDRGCDTPASPPGTLDQSWARLFLQFREEPGPVASLHGSTGKLSAEGFVKLWTAVLRKEGDAQVPDVAELMKVFRIVLSPGSNGFVSREDFLLRAPHLWECRSGLSALPLKLAAIDADVIDQLFIPQAKAVPRHMLAMLFQQFLKGGGGALQFSKLYAAVAKQYQVQGAAAEDVMEAYDSIVLCGATESQLQEATFVRRFNIIWQRQGEIAALSRIIKEASTPDTIEAPSNKRSILRASKFDAAGPGLANRRKTRVSVAESERASLSIVPGQNPMAVPRASLKGSPAPSPTDVSTITMSSPSEDRLSRLDEDEMESSQVQMFLECSPPGDSDVDSQPRLRGGAGSARSPWDDGSSDEETQQKAKGKAKSRARGNAADKAQRSASPRRGNEKVKPTSSKTSDDSDENARQRSRPKSRRTNDSEEDLPRPKGNPKSVVDAATDRSPRDDDSDQNAQPRVTAKAKAKRKAASRSQEREADQRKPNLDSKSKARVGSSPRREAGSSEESGEKKPVSQAKKGKAALPPRGAAKTRDPLASDGSEEEGKRNKKAASNARSQPPEGLDEAVSETSSTVGGTTPRGRKVRSSYAEERKLARARAKAGQRPLAPEVDPLEFSKPVQADELPEDDGSQWGGVRGEVRFVQWPGTSQWAESLDDNAGRAVGASLAQLAADRALDTNGASERRLRALLDGPQHRPVRTTSPMPSAIGIPSREESTSAYPMKAAVGASQLPSAQLLPPSPRNVSPTSSGLPREREISPSPASNTPRAVPGPLAPPSPAWASPQIGHSQHAVQAHGTTIGATASRSLATASRSPVARVRERPDLPSLPPQLLQPPSLSPTQVLKTSRSAEKGAELHQDCNVFREMLCIVDEPGVHWIADEMMATLLPSNVHPLDPQSRDPLVLEALSRCAPEIPPILYLSLASGTPEVLLRHPFQEVFDQTVALASLMEKSTSPQVLVDAAEEAWISQYNKAVTGWREERALGGAAEYINAETGERSATDPRQHLLRELQLGCRLMAMLRARGV